MGKIWTTFYTYYICFFKEFAKYSQVIDPLLLPTCFIKLLPFAILFSVSDNIPKRNDLNIIEII